MSPLLISLVVFFGIQVAIGALYFVYSDKGGKLGDRLDALTGRKKKEDEATSILKKTSLDRDKRNLLEMLTPNIVSLQKLIVQADVNIKASTLFGIGALLAFLGFTGSVLAGVKIYLAPLTGITFFFIPFIWLLWKRKSRLDKFAAQLPDAMELIARALRAGHSLAAGMHVVGEEMPLPVSTEFNRVYEEQNLGIAIDDSLRNLCDRIPNLDLRFFVTSVLIQRQTGGDLAEILDKIGHIIRERYVILGMVKSLTAEGRLSGIILIALPFGLFLMMLNIKYDYVEKLWTHELGIKMSVTALIMQLIGALVIRKIVNIKV
jgi:tight adherence protein B